MRRNAQCAVTAAWAVPVAREPPLITEQGMVVAVGTLPYVVIDRSDNLFQLLPGGEIHIVGDFVQADLRNQRDINFWLGRTFGTVTPKDSKDSSKKCKKDKPDGFSDGYSFADAGGIIHGQACRDNASFKIFTTRFRSWKLVVVSHEIGHAAFSLSDEYVGIDTLYFTLPDYPNLLGGENSCRNAAEKRGFNPDNCRNLKADGASGVFLGADWIFEPNFRNDAEPWNEVRDLMQQTGGEGPCTSPTTGEDILCKDRYKVGISEIYRMNWKMDKCRAGRC